MSSESSKTSPRSSPGPEFFVNASPFGILNYPAALVLPPKLEAAPASAILARVSPIFFSTLRLISLPDGSTPTFCNCLTTTSLSCWAFTCFANFALKVLFPLVGSMVAMLELVLLMMTGSYLPWLAERIVWACFFRSLADGTGGCFSFTCNSSFLITGGSLTGCFGFGGTFGFLSSGTSYFGFGGGFKADPNASFGAYSFYFVEVLIIGVGSNFLLSGGGKGFFSYTT